MSGRADAAIVDLSFTPRPPGSRKLAGREDMWRVRIGDWRILYRIDDAAPRVTVARVLHRSQAYR